jgi:hypothetical protein
MRGNDVKKLQKKLIDLGYKPILGEVDGIFGKKTEKSVREFQRLNSLIVDGMVGPKTWDKLLSGNAKPYIAFQRVALHIPGELWDFHGFYNSIRWRLTKHGVEVEGSGIERTRGRPITVTRVWNDFKNYINEWADYYVVPVELIVATICTESRGKADAVRKEPKYISDEETPNQISPGLMQTLISTARAVLNKYDIDRAWLLEPRNSIQAGTAYIRAQYNKTNFDPPKVACAYNAGGIYYNESSSNRWKMRQYPIGKSEHADRFIQWFNDFVYLLRTENIKPKVSYFT